MTRNVTVNPGPQELPDPLGGLVRLRRAEQELVDVGQALPYLEHDIHPGLGCRRGQAVQEQQNAAGVGSRAVSQWAGTPPAFTSLTRTSSGSG